MINWFPGHMSKALKQIKEKEKIIDLFIVVLDSRAPMSTYNYEFDKLAQQKPRLFIISKKDMGDQKKFDGIKKEFNHENDLVMFANLKNNKTRKEIIKNMGILLETKKQREKRKGLMKPRLRVMVIGVPNSGKSTLINLLAKQRKAKVADMPGVTRGQQWVTADEFQLLDTPGILWPKISDELVGVKLAIIGSVNMEAIDKNYLLLEGYKLLSKYYPHHLESIGMVPSNDEVEIYNNIILLCKNRKFITNGNIDKKRGIAFFLNHLRKLTNVTYDSVE